MADRIWTNLSRLTPSSCGDLDCSKKYNELRVKKNWKKGREMPASVPRGTAIHSALRSLHANRRNDKLPMDQVDTLACEAAFSARYGGGVDRDAEAERIASAVRLFVDNQDPEDVTAIIALETQIEFDYFYQNVGLACISATIDRVLVRPDAPHRLIVQDYKTGSQKIDLREAFLLLWCAKRQWPDYSDYALEYIWIDLDENQVTMDVVESRHVKGQIKLITQALWRIKHMDPVPEPGLACTFCQFREECAGLPAVRLDDGDDVF